MQWGGGTLLENRVSALEETATGQVSLVSGNAVSNVIEKKGSVVCIGLRIQNMQITANTVFGSIPQGFRPKTNITAQMLANLNNAWTTILGDIQTDGNLRFIWGSATVTQVIVNATYLTD